MVYKKTFIVEIASLDHIPSDLYIERFEHLFPNISVTVLEGVKVSK